MHINSEYLIVISSLKKLKNRLHIDEKTDWPEDKQLKKKANKNLKKPTMSVASVCVSVGLLSMPVIWSPRYRVSVLSTKSGVCHPKGIILASLYKIIIIILIIIIIIIITTTILIFTTQFSFLLDKKKKSTETHKNPGKFISFDPLAEKILKGY